MPMEVKNFARFLVVAVILVIRLSQFAEGAKAFYAFGDSFVTAGNGGYMGPPYGMTWPGYPAGRASDGRNQVDVLAELFGVPSPMASFELKNDSESVAGVNFAQGGGAVTYAFGYTPLDKQVNHMESLVRNKALSKSHLRRSVALVSLGVNDYGAYNALQRSLESPYAAETNTTITTVVDGIAMNLVRLHGLGLRNIVVANLACMVCSPYITVASNYTACSSNATLAFETEQHNSLLVQRVRLLKQQLRGAHFVIVDQTKAFQHLFQHGASYGFENVLTPCCVGKNDSHVLNCGYTDDQGNALYKVCSNATKAVIFDGIHPTQAAWQAVINLYTYVAGYTLEGPKLSTWIHKYNV